MTDPTLLFRLLVLILFIVNLKILLGNILQTYDTFNPSYKGYYFKQQCLQPALGIGIAIILILIEDNVVAWLIHK